MVFSVDGGDTIQPRTEKRNHRKNHVDKFVLWVSVAWSVAFVVSGIITLLAATIKHSENTTCVVHRLEHIRKDKLMVAVSAGRCSTGYYYWNPKNPETEKNIPWANYPCVKATSVLGVCHTYVGGFSPPEYPTPRKYVFILVYMGSVLIGTGVVICATTVLIKLVCWWNNDRVAQRQAQV